MRVSFYVVAGVVLLALLGWLGLQVRPRPSLELDLPHLETAEFVTAPANVPLPVQRFINGLYGNRVPVFVTLNSFIADEADRMDWITMRDERVI